MGFGMGSRNLFSFAPSMGGGTAQFSFNSPVGCEWRRDRRRGLASGVAAVPAAATDQGGRVSIKAWSRPYRGGKELPPSASLRLVLSPKKARGFLCGGGDVLQTNLRELFDIFEIGAIIREKAFEAEETQAFGSHTESCPLAERAGGNSCGIPPRAAPPNRTSREAVFRVKDERGAYHVRDMGARKQVVPRKFTPC